MKKVDGGQNLARLTVDSHSASKDMAMRQLICQDSMKLPKIIMQNDSSLGGTFQQPTQINSRNVDFAVNPENTGSQLKQYVDRQPSADTQANQMYTIWADHMRDSANQSNTLQQPDNGNKILIRPFLNSVKEKGNDPQ